MACDRAKKIVAIGKVFLTCVTLEAFIILVLQVRLQPETGRGEREENGRWHADVRTFQLALGGVCGSGAGSRLPLKPAAACLFVRGARWTGWWSPGRYCCSCRCFSCALLRRRGAAGVPPQGLSRQTSRGGRGVNGVSRCWPLPGVGEAPSRRKSGKRKIGVPLSCCRFLSRRPGGRVVLSRTDAGVVLLCMPFLFGLHDGTPG